MFEPKDLIVYGATGVCEVIGIGTPPIEGIDKSRKYYKLQPVYSNEGIIYTPVENGRVAMRHVMTEAAARELIDNIGSFETVKSENQKQWETSCKEAMRNCDSETCCRIVKTLYIRKMKRRESGRKATTIDERFLHNMGDHLFGEMAIALNISREEVSDYVLGLLEKDYLNSK